MRGGVPWCGCMCAASLYDSDPMLSRALVPPWTCGGCAGKLSTNLLLFVEEEGVPRKSGALISAGVIIGILDLIGEVKATRVLDIMCITTSGSDTRISQLLSALLLPSGITMHRIRLL